MFSNIVNQVQSNLTFAIFCIELIAKQNKDIK